MTIIGGSFYEGSWKSNRIVYIWPERPWKILLVPILVDSLKLGC